MGNSDNQRKMPTDVAVAVGKIVYSYGSFSELSEERLLTASEAVAPYYPMSEDEDTAAVTLLEWLTARQVEKEAVAPLDKLREVAESGVRAWRDSTERLRYEWERVYGRRHKEERYPEMHHELLHKELYHVFKSGDPRALIEAIERIVTEAILRTAPFDVGQPPQVHVPKEMVDAAKELAEASRRDLAGYVERVARAKHALGRYVLRVVAVEGITSKKD
jgi:hypothetical protein